VDDARLVIANAMDAAERGARILVGTECLVARREGALWHASLSGGVEVRARAIVNAAGPWVKDVLNQRLGQPSRDAIRLVKGSHIVLPRLYEGEHAFILQNDDRRVVFMIPWEGRFTLVGTTDIPVAAPDQAEATQDEVDYLCRAVNRYLERPVAPRAVLWRYAGVRPLYDDGSSDPSAVTRDYTLRLDAAPGAAPVLSVFGGKITTYRKLAEHALEKLAPYFPRLRGAWTGQIPLPGSDFKNREEARKELLARHRDLPAEVLQGVFRRHGTRALQVLGDGQLGEHFGAGLTERELRYFIEREWARGAQDVLWRRTKAGLHLDQRARARVEAAFSR
jgi:glycerol-3-phosphate dehydrogenase